MGWNSEGLVYVKAHLQCYLPYHNGNGHQLRQLNLSLSYMVSIPKDHSIPIQTMKGYIIAVLMTSCGNKSGRYSAVEGHIKFIKWAGNNCQTYLIPWLQFNHQQHMLAFVVKDDVALSCVPICITQNWGHRLRHLDKSL